MKKILLLSDLDGKPPNVADDDLETADFILIAGDISLGSKSESRFNKEITKISERFANKIVYFTIGNGDLESALHHNYPENMKLLHNKFILMDELKDTILIGFGGAKIGLRNAFAFEEDEMRSMIFSLFESQRKLYPNHRVLLMVHDAPNDTKCDLAFNQNHIGSVAIRDAVEKFKPDLVVCGHVHESAAVDTIGKSVIVNAGANDRGHYAIITINKDWGITAELKKITTKRG
jgi:hypothetical protein